MAKTFNILMVGVGGQGIIMASDIVSLAAMYAGLDVKKSEIHGMSQRGGSVSSHIRFGEKVHSPVISQGEADVLFSLEEMETLRWLGFANSVSRVICLRNRITPQGIDEYPQNLEAELVRICPGISFVEPGPLKDAIGDARFLNVALVGLLSTFTNFEESAWAKAIEEKVPRGTFEGNWKAFLEGKKMLLKAINTL
jgi:indolepyruvate ferredoxin oxidoreductase beta subunit